MARDVAAGRTLAGRGVSRDLRLRMLEAALAFVNEAVAPEEILAVLRAIGYFAGASRAVAFRSEAGFFLPAPGIEGHTGIRCRQEPADCFLPIAERAPVFLRKGRDAGSGLARFRIGGFDPRSQALRALLPPVAGGAVNPVQTQHLSQWLGQSGIFPQDVPFVGAHSIDHSGEFHIVAPRDREHVVVHEAHAGLPAGW